jgi:phospholipase A1
MLKKIKFFLVSLFLIFSISSLNAEDKKDNTYIKKAKLPPIGMYKDNYFLFGNKEDQVKVQLSFKYSLFKNYDLGIFLGYYQLLHWKFYDRSSPIIDVNFGPELFMKSKRLIPFLDYIQFSLIEHLSNGRDGKDSRALNRTYLQAQYSFGNDTIKLGLNTKLMYYYKKETTKLKQFSTDKNYNKYTNYYIAKLFFNIKGYEVYGKSSGFKYGWREIGFLSNKIYKTNLKLYIQYRTGYFESLLYYCKKDTAIRVGVILL